MAANIGVMLSGNRNIDEWSALKELRKENRRLRMEAEFLKNAAFFASEKANDPVALKCHALEISRSGCYAWLHRKESRHEAMDKKSSRT